MNRAIKSIAFNLDDPYEERILNHAKKYPNFSSYLKRLIQRDMEGNHHQTFVVETTDNNDDESLMKNFL